MMKRIAPLTALFLSVVLLGSACSDTSRVVSQPADDDPAPATTDAQPDAESGSDDVITASDRDDLISLQPHTIRSVENGDNGSSVIVEFLGGIGNCSGYVATATVTAEEVFVELQQGLHPNVAAMSCPAGQESRTLVLELGQPVGDRSLRYDPEAILLGPPDGGELVGPVLDPADYIGLSYADGVALAESSGFTTRLMRDGDEFFAGTADFRPDRLNFEIDDDVVTTVSPG